MENRHVQCTSPHRHPSEAAMEPGRILGQKRPLMPKHVWAIRVRLELSGNLRDLALFNLAIDSKLRGCDLVRLKVSDLVVVHAPCLKKVTTRDTLAVRKEP